MILAWHFVGATLRDGRPIPADGAWLEHVGRIEICSTGLHASRRPAHALGYAPGATLCLVECDGIKEEQDDKLVCRRRKIIARMDAADMLRFYARMQAVKALEFWPDPPDVVLDWLMTGDETQRDAAWTAAWDAARDAAWTAARDAAWTAAWDAARDAAWDAARDAAWTAAWTAAWDAARVAARDAAWTAARVTARDAAWTAAWDAARVAAQDEFDALVYECFSDFLPAHPEAV